MFKKIAFLAPRPDLSQADFLRHWRHVHGPLVANAPDYARWRRCYAQNHIRGPGLNGTRPSFAGMAVFGLPDANEDRYALSPTYRDHVRPDELNFIDMDRTVSLTAVEHVLRAGRSDTKLLVLTRRAAHLTRSDYRDALLHRLGRAASQAGLAVVGQVLNLTEEGSDRLPGGRPSRISVPDAIHEIWLAGDPRCASAVVADAIGLSDAELHEPDATVSFLAEEIVFFENGRALVAPERIRGRPG